MVGTRWSPERLALQQQIRLRMMRSLGERPGIFASPSSRLGEAGVSKDTPPDGSLALGGTAEGPTTGGAAGGVDGAVQLLPGEEETKGSSSAAADEGKEEDLGWFARWFGSPAKNTTVAKSDGKADTLPGGAEQSEKGKNPGSQTATGTHQNPSGSPTSEVIDDFLASVDGSKSSPGAGSGGDGSRTPSPIILPPDSATKKSDFRKVHRGKEHVEREKAVKRQKNRGNSSGAPGRGDGAAASVDTRYSDPPVAEEYEDELFEIPTMPVQARNVSKLGQKVRHAPQLSPGVSPPVLSPSVDGDGAWCAPSGKDRVPPTHFYEERPALERGARRVKAPSPMGTGASPMDVAGSSLPRRTSRRAKPSTKKAGGSSAGLTAGEDRMSRAAPSEASGSKNAASNAAAARRRAALPERGPRVDGGERGHRFLGSPSHLTKKIGKGIQIGLDQDTLFKEPHFVPAELKPPGTVQASAAPFSAGLVRPMPAVGMAARPEVAPGPGVAVAASGNANGVDSAATISHQRGHGQDPDQTVISGGGAVPQVPPSEQAEARRERGVSSSNTSGLWGRWFG